MDLSLDQIIKNSAATKKPAKKAPGGAKGKVSAMMKSKAPGGKGKNGALKGAVGKKSKRPMKAMDVEMGVVGKKGKGKKAKGVAGKLTDTLKARIAAAVSKRGGTIAGQRKGTTPTKAADIKITISGKGGGAAAAGRAPGGGFMFKPLKGQGRGGVGGNKGGARPRGGSMVKPGTQQQSARKALGGKLSGIGKKAQKTRKVVVGSAKTLAGAIAGRGRGKGKGGGRGGKKAGGGRGGKTLAQRFGGR